VAREVAREATQEAAQKAGQGLAHENAQDGAPEAVSVARFLGIFSAVVLPMFLAVADQTLLATASASIGAEFSNLAGTPWIATAYLIAMTITAPVYGRLGDRHGRRDMLLLAMGLFALGSLACGAAQGLATLVAGRVLQGLGGGGLVVLSQALIGERVPPRQRARFQVFFATNFTVASVGGPVIGGLVVHHASWRWLFLANLPLCAAAAWRLLRLPAARPPLAQGGAAPIPDRAGLLLFALAASCTLVGISGARHLGHAVQALELLPLLLAVPLWVLLARRELREPQPFLPVELLREPSTAWMSLAVVCFGVCMFALVFYLPIYVQLVLGGDARDSGLLLLPVTGGIVVGSTTTGRLIARRGQPHGTPVAGLVLAALALAALAILPAGRRELVVLGVLCGMGLGTVMPTAQIVVQWLAGRERLGAAAALVTLARSSGAALGTAAIGALVFGLMPEAAQLPGPPAGPSVGLDTGLAAGSAAHAFRAGFGLAALVAVLGALAAARVRRIHF
jgi:EmrB/QacA subfamily drug resistance transporter